MALIAPGVEVQVSVESFFASGSPSTVPFIVIATESNKQNQSGTGISPGTTKDNTNNIFSIGSQRELIQTFGEPKFKNFQGTPVHGDETNEYGLFSAYSFLGIANRAFIARADVPLEELEPQSFEPRSNPAPGTYWLDINNTSWGIFRSNGASTPGIAFDEVSPIVIDNEDLIEIRTSNGQSLDHPAEFIGVNGDIAVIATSDIITMFEKINGNWFLIGSDDWKASTPTTISGNSNSSTSGGTLEINGIDIEIVSGDTSSNVANKINSASITNILAEAPTNIDPLTITNIAGEDITIDNTTGTPANDFGFTPSTIKGNKLFFASHTKIPSNSTLGDIWIKTTNPNGGADWNIKQFNSSLKQFVESSATLFDSVVSASRSFGTSIPAGNLFVEYDLFQDGGFTDPEATFKIKRWNGQSTTFITGLKKGPTITKDEQLSINKTVITIPKSGSTSEGALDALISVINGSNIPNIKAEKVATVNKAGNIRIVNTKGGSIDIRNVTNGPVNDLGLEPGIFSNWTDLVYEASTNEPSSPPQEGRLWYNTDFKVDIMVSDGQEWFGYNNFYPNADIILSASRPFTQRDGTPLETNDLWINTSKLEEYPVIKRYNASTRRFESVDKSDQSTPFGIIFGDARENTGPNILSFPSNPGGFVSDNTELPLSENEIAMRYSNYVDPDAPDPLTFPNGMMLFNTRFSTLNVKEYQPNYFGENGSGEKFLDDDGGFTVGETKFTFEDLELTGTARWVTKSGNQVNGEPWMGRKAQRQIVIRAMASILIENQDIRSDNLFFNLISTPGYPELLDEMVTLNADKSFWAFIVGDTPARLEPNSTSIQNWATNVNDAPSTNDDGLTTRDTYAGLYYPWGLSTNLDGNEIVVPPSALALRTIAFNDQVSFQWFAPAGFNRGTVSNAASVGFINNEGEYQPVDLSQGIRDTMAINDINPIVQFPSRGLVVFGQDSLEPINGSPLEKINVVRLVNYLRFNLEQLAKPFLFEPNDQQTRDSIQIAFERFIGDLVTQRAVSDFGVLANTDNNTPDRINRNELWVDVFIIPVRAVEKIFIPIRLLNEGDDIPT